MKYYTILTEEVPSKNEISFLAREVLMISQNFDYLIEPVIEVASFTGEWLITVNSHINIIVKLFKGESSCVDYILFDGLVDDNTNAGNALCILESTKTSDKSSRNTSVYQRITKFLVFKKMHPESQAKMVMFYNAKWSNIIPSKTAIFGLRMMKTLGIDAYHSDDVDYENLLTKFSIIEFLTIEDMIDSKKCITSKKGNVPVEIINNGDSKYVISCKLDKGVSSNSGKISHDPNVGLLSGLVNIIHNFDRLSEIKIVNHNINQLYFDKLPTSKFWYAIDGTNVNFENVMIIKQPMLPSKYFALEKRSTEKLSTILYSQLISKDYKCIFSNHSGCALTNIITKGDDIIVERTMTRPDILFYNEVKNELLLIEGKVEKDIILGVKQLGENHLERFAKLVKDAYPNSNLRKGLCITIDSVDNMHKYTNLDYPVLFALDTNGTHVIIE